MPLEIKIALISLLGIVITGACSIVVSVVQTRKSQAEIVTKLEHHSEIQDVKLDAKIDKYAAVTDTKIEELTREVRLHNGFAERIPKMEAQINGLRDQLTGR